MASTGPILPVVNLQINYDEERANIKDFLTHFKGPVPALRASSSVVKEPDTDDEDADGDAEGDADLEDGFGELDIAPGARTTRGRGRNASSLKYKEQLQRICNRQQDALVIDVADVHKHRFTHNQEKGTKLAIAMTGNAHRFIELFSEVVDSELKNMVPAEGIDYRTDVLDVIMEQRIERNSRVEQGLSMQQPEDGEDEDGGEAPAQDEEPPFPPALLRRYNLYLKPANTHHSRRVTGDDATSSSSSGTLAVRAVRGAHLGKLITVRGIVTRVSEVKPFLLVDAYSCDQCGAEIFQEVNGRAYLPLDKCPSKRCMMNRTRGVLHQQTRASKFTSFQEVKVQEMADQVPVGHIPRSMTIHLYGPLTRSLNPGDVADIAGVFLPTPYTGFKAVRAGLLTDTYLDAQHVTQLKKQYEAMELTPEMSERISALKDDPALYAKLAASIAPEIYGHEDVKKCLLLLLVGGVTKSVGDGMKIRGDINVCLMGDPGVAKSQLLKYISKVAPRGVYTTGRGSSGVGLTAAVMRDPVTEEMVLEGGALVLADNGIACIDEFDKMDESDRTAIHEVMEQQTISINKAGISTTLNARTSILAAANPLYGRYNPRISPVDNINLPAALLSRFDVLFLILDTPSREDDERLAQHVSYVHMNSEHPPLEHEPLDANVMRHYIALARQKRPTVPRVVSEYVVGAYVKLRAQGAEEEAKEQAYSYTSARTLLGVLRLSQALARLRFADSVDVADVDEALRLMDVSKASLHADGRKRAGEEWGDSTPISKIYRIIRDMALAQGAAEREEAMQRQKRSNRRPMASTGRLGRGPAGERGDDGQDMDVDDDEVADATYRDADNAPGELQMRDVRARILAGGWVEDQLQECINEYSDLGVLQVIGNRLTFL
ncbi:putative ATP dependent DNA helicase [Ceraceosorus guamensis]|uniref:DNA replication licensing factor MCM7 n=1 Tax=Ceraceosorus guamensis TaxID=1522189 RepID=A0A316VRM9_9BASI|nr:putative ATP dependent DNA helicase [Ceraceosorus guamensis]PWN40309.1 putative ATP dependent DNA helicase [Ceraceosorus guamensis]